mmetsp:Transcript_2631/g.7368  ORF Transcript_2631/g.7368 Transcript_2631/m.7368 type:complete len:333 (+) Transcript_2631:267-1265(+)
MHPRRRLGLRAAHPVQHARQQDDARHLPAVRARRPHHLRGPDLPLHRGVRRPVPHEAVARVGGPRSVARRLLLLPLDNSEGYDTGRPRGGAGQRAFLPALPPEARGPGLHLHCRAALHRRHVRCRHDTAEHHRPPAAPGDQRPVRRGRRRPRRRPRGEQDQLQQHRRHQCHGAHLSGGPAVLRGPRALHDGAGGAEARLAREGLHGRGLVRYVDHGPAGDALGEEHLGTPREDGREVPGPLGGRPGRDPRPRPAAARPAPGLRPGACAVRRHGPPGEHPRGAVELAQGPPLRRRARPPLAVPGGDKRPHGVGHARILKSNSVCCWTFQLWLQ